MPITDLERRTIGNLPHPRNVAELTHALRIDPHTPTRDDVEVLDHLSDLSKDGLVLNIGEHAHIEKVPGVTERNPRAVTMPDEMAKVYTSRLSAPSQRWRGEGPLWVMTADGMEVLHLPVVDPVKLTPSEIQAIIDSEWARVVHGPIDFTDPDLKIADKLLPEEFARWVGPVVEDCQRVWNVRLRVPVAGGSQFSDFYENILLDVENQKATATAAAPWFMALTTVAVTDVMTGSTITEPSYTTYGRASVAAGDMAAASGTSGSVSNTTAITFAACTAGTPSPVIGFAHCVAATVSNVRKFGTCTSTEISPTQTPATFAIGAYTTTIA